MLQMSAFIDVELYRPTDLFLLVILNMQDGIMVYILISIYLHVYIIYIVDICDQSQYELSIYQITYAQEYKSRLVFTFSTMNIKKICISILFVMSYSERGLSVSPLDPPPPLLQARRLLGRTDFVKGILKEGWGGAQHLFRQL